jgi:hypothetical protein
MVITKITPSQARRPKRRKESFDAKGAEKKSAHLAAGKRLASIPAPPSACR